MLTAGSEGAILDPEAPPTCEEGKDLSPSHESASPLPPPPPPHKMDPPAGQQQHGSISLAGLQLLNAYRWPTPASSYVDEYRVRWEGHASHLLQQVARLEQDPASADVTVATKGFTMPAHRIVLAAASKFFSSVLQRVPVGQHPVIVIRGADSRHLRSVIAFCYTGAVTIPAQDVQQVVKLADDLEITGLKVSCLTGSNSTPATSLPSLSPLGGPRPRLYRPSSPKRFTFTPIQNASPPASGHRNQEDLSVEKRLADASSLHDTQGRKRFRGDPLPGVGDRETRPNSSSPPSGSTPPGSAPPNFPSTSFFARNHPSPPNSAPPHAIANHLSYEGDASLSTAVKNEESPQSLVPPSRVLEPIPLPATPSGHSAPPSPYVKREHPLSPPFPTNLHVPNTPNSLALALKEPLTPSTPKTPTTPSLHHESGTHLSRMGLGSSNTSGCSTGSRVLLWRFLLDLLHDPRYSPIYIRWLDRAAGIFRIMESDMVAQLWGMARKNTNMNYEKMSRGMRTYYKRGILFHIDGTKLIYKFNTSDPEIQQRMRYYDLTQKSPDGADLTSEQQSGSSHASSPTLSNRLNLSNLSSLPSLSNLPAAVTSPSATPTFDSLYSPFLREVPQLPAGLLYDPYITSFLRATKNELF